MTDYDYPDEDELDHPGVDGPDEDDESQLPFGPPVHYCPDCDCYPCQCDPPDDDVDDFGEEDDLDDEEDDEPEISARERADHLGDMRFHELRGDGLI